MQLRILHLLHILKHQKNYGESWTGSIQKWDFNAELLEMLTVHVPGGLVISHVDEVIMKTKYEPILDITIQDLMEIMQNQTTSNH